MPTLVSVAEFKESAHYRDTHGHSDDEIAGALNLAETRFYKLTRRDKYKYWFVPKEQTYTVHGNGLLFIRFPGPVASLVSVTNLDNDTDHTDKVKAWGGHYLYHKQKWPNGIANIEVTAMIGDPDHVSEVPLDVKRAIMRMAKMHLLGDRQAGERYIDRRPPTDDAPPPPTLTGDREVDNILRSYMVDDISGSFFF